MNYYAHSENDKNEKHLLAKHLNETAQLAESFTASARPVRADED
jgi:hypothetical protein